MRKSKIVAEWQLEWQCWPTLAAQKQQETTNDKRRHRNTTVRSASLRKRGTKTAEKQGEDAENRQKGWDKSHSRAPDGLDRHIGATTSVTLGMETIDIAADEGRRLYTAQWNETITTICSRRREMSSGPLRTNTQRQFRKEWQTLGQGSFYWAITSQYRGNIPRCFSEDCPPKPTEKKTHIHTHNTCMWCTVLRMHCIVPIYFVPNATSTLTFCSSCRCRRCSHHKQIQWFAIELLIYVCLAF